MQLVPVVFAATISGLLLAPYYLVPHALSQPLMVVSLAVAVCLRRFSCVAVSLLFLSFFLLANLLYPLQFKNHSVIDRADQLALKHKIEGTVVDIRQRTGGRSSVDLRVSSLSAGDGDWALAEPFTLRLFLDQQPGELLPGDEVHFRGRIRKPRLFGTPGEFHWPRYLASQGVQATSWLKDVEQLQIKSGRQFSFRRAIADWKNSVRTFLQHSLPADRAELVGALVLGEGRSLSDARRRLLAASGISHLFAISGLHLGLLALFGYRFLSLVYRRFDRLLLWQPPQRILPLLLLPALLVYLLLTGDAIATRRAFALVFVGALLLLWRHHVQPLRLLIMLALIFLLCNPLLLWQPSWQLSFAGAAGILLWQPVWQNRLRGLSACLKLPLGLLLVTVAATLATLPLVLFNFHLLAPVGLLANLLCVPLVTMVALPAGMFGLILYPALPMLAGYCFALCGFMLNNILSLVGWLTSLPGFAGQYHYLTDWQYLGLFILLLPLLLCWQMKLSRRNFLLAGAAVFLGLILCFVEPADQSLQLTMFSVGQGESLLLQNQHRQAILVDGGGLYSRRFDVGERLLAPALGSLGVKELFAVALTHDHPDHRKGLLFLLEHFPVKQFWAGTPLAELDSRLQRIIVARGIAYRQFAMGWSSVPSWKNGTMKWFRAAEPMLKKNDGSLVLYLRDKWNGLLLTGDLERFGVGQLLAAGLPGPVSLLKLPHHGSRHSGTERLLDRLQPRYSLASAGYNNRYKLPARQLVDQLRERQIPLYRTDLQGSVRAESTAAGWRLSHWQSGLFR